MLPRKPVRIDPRVSWFGQVRTALSPMAGVTDRAFRDARPTAGNAFKLPLATRTLAYVLAQAKG